MIDDRTRVERVLDRLRNRNLEPVLVAIAEKHSATVEEVCGRDRRRHVSAARHELWSLLRERGPSYPTIAAWFERDHTTILFGVETHARRSVGFEGPMRSWTGPDARPGGRTRKRIEVSA